MNGSVLSFERKSLVLSPADRTRMEYVEALARAGDDGVAELLGLLSEPSWAVRRAVVAALASLGDAAVPGLCTVLQTQRDSETRLAAAVDALVASRADVNTPMVALARQTDLVPVVCDAVQVLGRRRAHPAVSLLGELSKSDDDNVAVAAIEALGRIGGPETVDALIGAVESRHFFRTFPAIDALGRTGDARAVDPLTALLADPLYAPEAARGLGHTGNERAVVPLAQLLLRPVDALVRTAAVALAELRERHESRFGDTPGLARALPEAVGPSAASARVIAAIPGVAPSELVAIARVLGWLGDTVAIEALISLVMEDPPVGPAATDALRRLAGRAAPFILAHIQSGTSDDRLRLLPIVGYNAEGIEALLVCLQDAEADVRVRACEALARAGDPGAVGALFNLIGDRDGRVSQGAAAAIQSLGSLETKRLALEQARSADIRTRRAALRIISYFGYPEGLDILVGALDDEDERVREAGIYGLPLLDDPRGVAALLVTSHHPSEKTRAAVMRALGDTQRATSIIAALREGIGDSDPWVRYYACQALGKLRIDEATAEIIGLMSDPSGQVRISAVEALARLSGDAAANALEKAATSGDADLQRAALVGLGIGRRPAALPTLRRAASSPDSATRLVAVGALAEFDAPEIVPALAHAASDPDEAVRSAAIGYLATRPGPDTTTALLDRLLDPTTRDRALEALAVAADHRVDSVLLALETSHADSAPLFIAALTRMRRPSSQAAIAAALSFENVHARRAAAAALVELATPEAREALQRGGSDIDPVVRRLCTTGIRP
jgi:HEAT repeat protein